MTMPATGTGSCQEYLVEMSQRDHGVDLGWLQEMHKVHPYMLASEILELYSVFMSVASPGRDGARVIGMESIKRLADAALKDLFSELDGDGSGQLDRDEIGALVGNLGKALPTEQLSALMIELDTDGDGQVDYPEFQKWWHAQQYATEEDYDRELMDLMHVMDENSNGEIDISEFLEMIGSQLRREDSSSKVGKTHRASPKSVDEEGVQFASRPAATMVRQALDSVRADIRSVYGSQIRGKARLQLRTESEQIARNRFCFFRPEGEGASVQFRRWWDLIQILLLAYVAVAVPFRIGFNQEAPVGSVTFIWEVLVDAYFWCDIVINFRTAHYSDSTCVRPTLMPLRSRSPSLICLLIP
jgi:calmodulin